MQVNQWLSVSLDVWGKTFRDNLSYKEMRRAYLDNLNRELILSACILNRSNSLFDRVVRFRENQTTHLALLWRNNLLFHHKICPVCSLPFHRTHIDNCNIFGLRDCLAVERSNLPDTYNYIDHLLNLGEEEEFKLIIHRLTKYFKRSSLPTKKNSESSQDLWNLNIMLFVYWLR